MVNANGSSLVLLIREYNATVGATDGNIIAAIITTQTPRNQPNVPRPLHGPLSMPRISPTVHHHPAAASAKRTQNEPELRDGWRRARDARPESAADRTSVIPSGGPREVRLRQAGLSFVLDAEGADP